MKPAPDGRNPASRQCWMCHGAKRIVKAADSPVIVLICDTCDSPHPIGPGPKSTA